MPTYTYNRSCSCNRCRLQGLMGAALIITTGVLGLLHYSTRFSFGQLSPVYLLVVGAMMLLGRTASTEGHIPLVSQTALATPPPGYAPQEWSGPGTPPPPASAGTPANDANMNDPQVKS
ncbi:MAG: hypothetical protein LAO20_07125 [Acidobacteriia bacterium]|nr:hypothetical protein [Terriglobia bacterium]